MKLCTSLSLIKYLCVQENGEVSQNISHTEKEVSNTPDRQNNHLPGNEVISLREHFFVYSDLIDICQCRILYVLVFIRLIFRALKSPHNFFFYFFFFHSKTKKNIHSMYYGLINSVSFERT